MFDEKDWYWLVNGEVYSSARNIYIPQNDEDYKTWMETRHNNVPAPELLNEAEVWFYVSRFMPASMWDGTTITKGPWK
jgi:hypothetical protein